MQRVINRLLHAGTLLSQYLYREASGINLLEYLLDVTGSDLSALYALPPDNDTSLPLLHSCGRFQPPASFDQDSESIGFLIESGEVLILNQPEADFFEDILLDSRFKSAATVPVGDRFVLFLNSKQRGHYGVNSFSFLHSFGRMAGEVLLNKEH